MVDGLELRYTFSENIANNHYHVLVTRNELTRHIPKLMPDIVHELEAAIEDEIVVDNGMPASDNLCRLDPNLRVGEDSEHRC